MEPLKDGYSMAWLEWLRRPGKEKLGNLYLELCPDNRIKSFMVTRHRPQGADSFMAFIDYTAGKAIKEGNRAVPNNLLLAFYGVPERILPPAEELLEKQPEETCRYVLKCGGVTEGNSVPLRRAVSLRAHGREINCTGLKEMERSPGCRNYEAYEAAMERLSEGKKASFRLSFIKTERGVRVFNDGLQGPERMRGLLQDIADRFYSPAWEGLGTLSVYRIETSSRRLLEMSQDNGRDFPASQPPLKILSGYLPTASFDMSPTADNLERFVRANSLTLSGNNREIMTLQDIARRGYAYLYTDETFRYRKEFAGIEKEFRTLARERELYRDLPYEDRMHNLREKSRAVAEFLLKREGIRREMPAVTLKTDKYAERIRGIAESPKKKTASPATGEKKKRPARKQKGAASRQVKPQL